MASGNGSVTPDNSVALGNASVAQDKGSVTLDNSSVALDISSVYLHSLCPGSVLQGDPSQKDQPEGRDEGRHGGSISPHEFRRNPEARTKIHS